MAGSPPQPGAACEIRREARRRCQPPCREVLLQQLVHVEQGVCPFVLVEHGQSLAGGDDALVVVAVQQCQGIVITDAHL